MTGKRISYATILAAKSGVPEAIDAILRHYEGYIEANARYPAIDGFPNSGGGLSEDMKAQIQEKLIWQIIYDFDPTQLPEGETLEP